MRQMVSYIRVSTSQQGKSGLGIEAQREAIARFLASEGAELLAEVVEVETGKGSDAVERRHKLAEALAKARKAKVPVVVAKFCRLSRDVAFISGLMAHRVPFIIEPPAAWQTSWNEQILHNFSGGGHGGTGLQGPLLADGQSGFFGVTGGGGDLGWGTVFKMTPPLQSRLIGP